MLPRCVLLLAVFACSAMALSPALEVCEKAIECEGPPESWTRIVSRILPLANEHSLCQQKMMEGCCFIARIHSRNPRLGTFINWACPNSTVSAKRMLINRNDVFEELDVPVYNHSHVPWHLDRIDQRATRLDGDLYSPVPTTNTSRDRAVHVYIVDSGIDPEHYVFRNVEVVMEYPSPEGAIDCNGHGTHVGSLVVGEYVGVNTPELPVILHSVRVLGCDGSGSLFGVISGLIHIADTAPPRTVVNLSLGATFSSLLNDAVNDLRFQEGFAVVASAGNANIDACLISPASAVGAFTVGATREGDSRSDFSNHGSCVNMFAPGSAVPGAQAFTRNALIELSGTSMSSPIVAGSVARAMVLGGPTTTPAEAITLIVHNATSGVLSGVRTNSPNLLSFVGVHVPPPGPMTPPPTTRSVRTEVDIMINMLVVFSYCIGMGW